MLQLVDADILTEADDPSLRRRGQRRLDIGGEFAEGPGGPSLLLGGIEVEAGRRSVSDRDDREP
jgi:hypothetical protein